MKITCGRRLWEVEIEALIGEAKLMLALKQNSNWVGNGALYRTTNENVFHFIDHAAMLVTGKGKQRNGKV